MKIIELDQEEIIRNKKPLSQSQKRAFIEEQINELSRLDGFNEQIIRKQLRDVGINIIPSMPEKVRAFYRDGEMYFLRKDVYSHDLTKKRLRTHECVHGIIGKNKPKSFRNLYGIEEGIAENVTEVLYGDNGISNIDDIVRFHLSENCEYCYNVSIIRQLEYILGKNTIDIITKGDYSFFKELRTKFGDKTYKDIVDKCNLLSEINGEDKEKVEILKHLQRTLLTHAFDAEFSKVSSAESAEIFLNRLREFERIRAAISEDSSFKTYYMEKLHQIEKLLLGLGIDKEKVQKFLEEHQYTGWTIKPEETDKQRAERIEKNLKRYLIYNIKYKELVTEKFIRSLEVRYYLKNGIECQIILRGGIPFGGIIRNTADANVITYKMVGSKVILDAKTNEKYGEVTFDSEILKGTAEGFVRIDLPGDKREFTEEVLTEIILRRIMKAKESKRKSAEKGEER